MKNNFNKTARMFSVRADNVESVKSLLYVDICVRNYKCEQVVNLSELTEDRNIVELNCKHEK